MLKKLGVRKEWFESDYPTFQSKSISNHPKNQNPNII